MICSQPRISKIARYLSNTENFTVLLFGSIFIFFNIIGNTIICKCQYSYHLKKREYEILLQQLKECLVLPAISFFYFQQIFAKRLKPINCTFYILPDYINIPLAPPVTITRMPSLFPIFVILHNINPSLKLNLFQIILFIILLLRFLRFFIQ